MSANYFRGLSIILTALIIAISYILRLYEPGPIMIQGKNLESVINKYIMAGNFGYGGIGYSTKLGGATINSDHIFLDNCLKIINEEYGKEIRGVNFNGPINKDYINFYFLEKDPDALFKDIGSNCTYLGYKNIIVCDLKFVRDFQSYEGNKPDTGVYSMGADAAPPELKSSIKTLNMVVNNNAWFWLIGHEMGHIARGHISRHYTFDGEDNHLITNYDKKKSNEENEADELCVKAISEQFSFYFYMFLAGYINYQAEKLINAQGKASALSPLTDKNWTSNESFEVKPNSITHPPLLLRAIDLQLQLIKTYNIESPEYYNKLKSRIKIRK